MILSESGFRTIKQSLKEKLFFGNEPTPELIAILTIYFVQGILGLARLAVSFFLKDDLALTPAKVAALMGVAALPWVIKPLFGFLSDGLPIFGYRRRPYIILSGILGTLSWLSLATIVHTAWAATVAILLTSLSVAISDVIADSIVVERARKESLSDSGSLQSLTWGASALGGLITAYLSGLLLQHFGTTTIFFITATFPLLVCGVAWLIVEKPVSEEVEKDLVVSNEDHSVSRESKMVINNDQDGRTTDINGNNNPTHTNFARVGSQIKQLRQAITQKSIWLPTAFVFIWQATPTADSAFFFFTTNELGFQPEFLGRVRLVTSLASLVGIWLFQRFLKTVPFRKIMGWSTIISATLGMTALLLVTHANRSLGIDDHWFSLGDSLILTVIGQIAFMPVLVLSARLCPEGVEATLFALLMSVWNLAGLLSHEMGAVLTHWLGVTETNFDNLWLLVVITNLTTLLPLPFLGWLPKGDPQEMETEAQGKALQPAELFEHHTPGSQMSTPMLPEIMPELAATGKSVNSKQ